MTIITYRKNDGIRKSPFGSHHQWILKLVSKSIRSNRIFIVSKNLLIRSSLIPKDNRVTSRWKKLEGTPPHTPHHMSKLTLPGITHVPPDLKRIQLYFYYLLDKST